jgi:hypothetical protein
VEEFVSLKQLAGELGLDRSNTRKYVLKSGVRPHKRPVGENKELVSWEEPLGHALPDPEEIPEGGVNGTIQDLDLPRSKLTAVHVGCVIPVVFSIADGVR